MNIKSLLSTTAIALLLGACSGNQALQNTVSADTQAKADSLIYSFGQLRGAEFLKAASRDSLLETEAARQEYIRGVRAGLEAVKNDKEAYNRGVMLGVQMAGNINQFYEDYGIRLSDRMFLKGMTEAIMSDSSVNAKEAQEIFYRLINDFNKEKETRDKEAAMTALKAAGEALGMKQISDQLWGTLPESGADLIKRGDNITIDLKLSSLSGKEINSPFPKELVVGQRLSNNPISEAITTLTSGQKGTFITSAQSLFGARAQQLGLKPADVVKISVTPTIVEKDNAE